MTVAASSRQGAIRDPALFPIADRVAAGERLSTSDAVTLFRSPDILGVGTLADAVNCAKHGDVVTFAANQHINPTNVCILRKTCVFCGYARLPKEEGAAESGSPLFSSGLAGGGTGIDWLLISPAIA